jgi:hypothetical protein
MVFPEIIINVINIKDQKGSVHKHLVYFYFSCKTRYVHMCQKENMSKYLCLLFIIEREKATTYKKCLNSHKLIT